MRRFLAVCMAIVMVAAVPAPAAGQALLDSNTDRPGVVTHGGHPSFIITYDGDGTNATAALDDWANASADRQVIAHHRNNTTTVAAPRVHVVGGFGAALDAIRTGEAGPLSVWGITPLADRPYVESIELNRWRSYAAPVDTLQSESEYESPTIGLLGVNDPDYPTEGVAFSDDANRTTMAEARAAIGADNVSATGDNVTVAVIDTGTAVSEPPGEVFGNGTANSSMRIDNASKSFISNESVDTSADDYDAIEDRNGHGTWVSSAIAANASGTVHDGVAPDATLLVLKAMNEDGEGSTSDIAEAIRYAADHNASIISMSLGSPLRSQALIDAIEYAYAQGVQAVVVAAGNSRATRSPGIASPADTPGVIAVGATNGSGPATAASAYFSQVSGAQPTDGSITNREVVDVAAPGMEVVARTPGEDGLLANSTLSGTSMATPLVAGSIAAAMGANDTLSGWNHSRVETAVFASARPTPNAAVAEVGNGTIAADNLADGTEPEQSQPDAMTDAARQRQAFYEAWAAQRGSFLQRFGD